MAAVSFLFWNLKKRPRAEVLTSVVAHHAIDVVILAENSIEPSELAQSLSVATDRKLVDARSESEKIHVLNGVPNLRILPLFDDASGRLTVRRLRRDGPELLLAAVHLVAKVNWNDEEQRAELQTLARDLRRIEDEAGHRRTILVGDFNMNPFEKGMTSSHGLHAVMSREIARKRSRRVMGKDFPFFYNPMWGLFGDQSAGPAGTHYFRRPTPDMYFWNILDQVVIRPQLMEQFDGEVEILDHAGEFSLLTSRGFPDSNTGSDHLPIRFTIDI